MQAITTIGLDIAKSVFQVHGIDAEGKVIIRRQLKRRYVLAFFQKLPPCLVGIEACATGGRTLASKDLVERLNQKDADVLGLDPDHDFAGIIDKVAISVVELQVEPFD